MRIGIIGSRNINVDGLLHEFNTTIETFAPTKDERMCFVGGGQPAPSADAVFMDLCRNMGMDYIKLMPYHLLDPTVPFSPKYFFKRNKQIMDNSDIIAFAWSGDEDEVAKAIKYAQKRDIPYMVLNVEKQEAVA